MSTDTQVAATQAVALALAEDGRLALVLEGPVTVKDGTVTEFGEDMRIVDATTPWRGPTSHVAFAERRDRVFWRRRRAKETARLVLRQLVLDRARYLAAEGFVTTMADPFDVLTQHGPLSATPDGVHRASLVVEVLPTREGVDALMAARDRFGDFLAEVVA